MMHETLSAMVPDPIETVTPLLVENGVDIGRVTIFNATSLARPEKVQRK